jgi:NAD(P)-dependent dehydrogenase (short-subunit alcohol dehydrogenase family)
VLSHAYLARLQAWVNRNRALTAALVAFFGTGGFLLWRESRKHKKKRRARRASNGARREVVVIAGSPSSPIVKSLSLDLERRGFIVYVVCTDMEEEQQVHSESRADVRPLHVDVVDPLGCREAMERFNKQIRRPQVAFSGASPHNLNFKALILVPDLIYPSGPIETISPEQWSDALNAKILKTIALTQTFLPTVCSLKARVLMMTPAIVSALRPPFHSVETAVVSALEGFTASLRGELGTLGIDVVQFKLGTFDYSHVGAKHHLQSMGSPNTEIWSTTARQSYASNYVNQSRVGRSRGLFSQSGNTGSSLRELHTAVFDAITQKHPRRVWHVGRGSVTYDVVGNWVPAGLVGWMLGVRRVSLTEMEPQLEDSAQSWEKVEASA